MMHVADHKYPHMPSDESKEFDLHIYRDAASFDLRDDVAASDSSTCNRRKGHYLALTIGSKEAQGP